VSSLALLCRTFDFAEGGCIEEGFRRTAEVQDRGDTDQPRARGATSAVFEMGDF
jgi:hypothetical protein